MKNDKIIHGCTVRQNPDHKRLWDVLETRAGNRTGKVTFTGTLAEIRRALRPARRAKPLRRAPGLLFLTAPHGSQQLYLSEQFGRVTNSLFTLEDDQARAMMLTGEELDSLAAQWVAYRKGARH